MGLGKLEMKPQISADVTDRGGLSAEIRRIRENPWYADCPANLGSYFFTLLHPNNWKRNPLTCSRV